ncbi:ataxin-2 [Heterostelium album PN500]|uniref:Ataxin-2 n=1 Tax=Heterostelium pallidum (strain ATCC 26659 / Pp 5 / PN500) TaxID=670386 RepID=D3BPE8_HETP5|nr:ataxin-2 [Heterostelium album PN500]EFA76666.1 ataxin-2 [Heterostelium album PN500]|eukprot:XP_020428798.1 ataxin-2 [Heterostelium album PN500]
MSHQQKDNKNKKFGGGGGGGSGGGGGYNNSPQQKHQSPKQHHHHGGGGGGHHHNNSPQQQSHSNNNNNSSSGQLDDSTKRMKERTVFMSMNLIGHHVAVQLKNGDCYEGILTSTNTSQVGWGCALKFARKREVSPPSIITTAPIPQLVIDAKDFLGLTATGIVFDNISQSAFGKEAQFGFHTDTDISGHDGVIRERELTPWVSEDGGENLESVKINPANANWDQFATNEKLFGVKTSYNEDLYTTTLNRDSDHYRTRIKDAERLAAEIESKQSNNIHLMEERGLIRAADYDEEERYSSVIRNGTSSSSTTSPPNNNDKSKNMMPTSNSNVYIPPSKRGSVTGAAGTSSPSIPPLSTQKVSPTTTTAAASTTSPTTKQSTTTAATTPVAAAAASAKPTASVEEKSTTTTTTSTTTSTAAASTTSPSNNSPSHQQQQQHFKESTSGSTGSLLKDSPVTKLRLRDRAGSIDHNDSLLNSPRDGQSPRTLQSYNKIRAAIVAEKLRNSAEPRSPLFSPLVSDPVGLSALSLDVSKPNISEDTIKEFNEFLLTKSTTEQPPSADRKSQIENLKNFSRDLSRSRPGSPLIGPNSPRPMSNLSSISLSGALSPRTSASDIPVIRPIATAPGAATTTTTTTTTSTTTDDKEKEKETTTDATAVSSSADTKKADPATKSETTTDKPADTVAKPISKLKLNPNAKEFTPVSLNSNAPVFTPKNFIPATVAKQGLLGSGNIEFYEANSRANTYPNISINDLYYESMKRRQQNPEQSNAPSTYWNESYGVRGSSQYGADDDYMPPAQYPPAMRPPFIQMGVPAIIPTYYPPPVANVAPGAPGVPVPVKSMKPIYNPQPRGQPYAPPPPLLQAPGAMGQPPPQYVFPPQFQYVPQVYPPPGGPHTMPPKRSYYPGQNPSNGYQPIQPHGIMLPQNTSQPPSPQHQSPQIPSPTSPPHHSRMVPSSPQMINPMYPYPMIQRYPPHGNDPNATYPPPYN